MWIYSQSTGKLWDKNGKFYHQGYAGKGEGKNNPDQEGVPFVGPIPRGKYVIGEAYNSPDKGPLVMTLRPIDHDALGRTDFLVHGDSIKNPGEASEGCVIMPRYVRAQINDSDDKEFFVV